MRLTSIRRTGALCLYIAMLSLTPLLTQAAEQTKMKSGEATGPTTSATSVASGAVEDSLKACMARIPKDASPGQRMMAEQSCERDEEARQPFDATQGQ